MRFFSFFILQLVALFSIIFFASCAGRQDAGINPVDAARMIGTGDYQLLDVRSKSEWDEGHLEGAVRVAYGEEGFGKRVAERLTSSKPVIIYCRSGNRSAKALLELEEADIVIAGHISGGINAWREAGLPIVKR